MSKTVWAAAGTWRYRWEWRRLLWWNTPAHCLSRHSRQPDLLLMPMHSKCRPWPDLKTKDKLSLVAPLYIVLLLAYGIICIYLEMNSTDLLSVNSRGWTHSGKCSGTWYDCLRYPHGKVATDTEHTAREDVGRPTDQRHTGQRSSEKLHPTARHVHFHQCCGHHKHNQDHQEREHYPHLRGKPERNTEVSVKDVWVGTVDGIVISCMLLKGS